MPAPKLPTNPPAEGHIRLSLLQHHTLPTTALTLTHLSTTASLAAKHDISLLLTPEAYLGGYPRGCSFGAAVGAREEVGREQFLKYFKEAVDLGDTPEGAGERWVGRQLPLPDGEGEEEGRRGDGTREELERIAKDSGVFLVVGIVERAGGTLYCGVVYVCPRKGCIGKRRKVMPTGSERLIWGQGSPSTLRAVTTTIKGVILTLAAAICWENYMPLLRHSLYSQNVNLYLAPTADGRDTWLPLMRTVACEGRCFVLSANQCVRKENLPEWVKIGGGKGGEAVGNVGGRWTGDRGKRRKSCVTEDGMEIVLCSKEGDGLEGTKGGEENGDYVSHGGRGDGEGNGASGRRRKSCVTKDGMEIVLCSKEEDVVEETGEDEDKGGFVSHGGSCIISPLGEVLAGPLWDVEDGLLTVDVDFDDCLRGRLDLDVGGSYSRNDSFKLTVEGLDLSPPP